MLAHLAETQVEVDELVVTADVALDEAALSRAAGREVRVVVIDDDADYYDAKNLGCAATQSDIVVFADSDCIPAAGWLAGLVRPLLEDDATVSAGRTRYEDTAFGRAASAIDFLYFTYVRDDVVYTRNFYANNVAFVREAFRGYARAEEIYRGPCQQMGMALFDAGERVVFCDDAVTVHRFPDRRRELLRLRQLRGSDAAMMSGDIARHVGLPRLARSRMLSTSAVLTGRAFFSLRQTRGRPRESAMMLGVHALDSLGAARALVGRRRRRAHREGLSYVA